MLTLDRLTSVCPRVKAEHRFSDLLISKNRFSEEASIRFEELSSPSHDSLDINSSKLFNSSRSSRSTYRDICGSKHELIKPRKEDGRLLLLSLISSPISKNEMEIFQMILSSFYIRVHRAWLKWQEHWVLNVANVDINKKSRIETIAHRFHS